MSGRARPAARRRKRNARADISTSPEVHLLMRSFPQAVQGYLGSGKRSGKDHELLSEVFDFSLSAEKRHSTYTVRSDRVAQVLTSATFSSPSVQFFRPYLSREPIKVLPTKPPNYSWNTRSRQFSPRSTNNHFSGSCKETTT